MADQTPDNTSSATVGAPDGTTSNGADNGAGNGGGSKVDNLILGKFKDQAELSKAYTEIERHARDKGSEAAVLKQQLDDLHSRLLALDATGDGGGDAGGGMPDLPPDSKEILTRFSKDPKGTLELLSKPQVSQMGKALDALTQKLTHMEARMQVRDAQTRYSDFARYAPQIQELAQKTGITDVDYLYRQAKFPDLESGMTDLRAKYEKAVRELKAHADVSPGGAPRSRNSAADEAIADAIVKAGVRANSPFI